MSIDYANAVEQMNHLKAIRELAKELDTSFDVAKKRYEDEFERLQTGAKLREYLLLLTARRVKKLSHRDSQEFAALDPVQCRKVLICG